MRPRSELLQASFFTSKFTNEKSFSFIRQERSQEGLKLEMPNYDKFSSRIIPRGKVNGNNEFVSTEII